MEGFIDNSCPAYHLLDLKAEEFPNRDITFQFVAYLLFPIV